MIVFYQSCMYYSVNIGSKSTKSTSEYSWSKHIPSTDPGVSALFRQVDTPHQMSADFRKETHAIVLTIGIIFSGCVTIRRWRGLGSLRDIEIPLPIVELGIYSPACFLPFFEFGTRLGVSPRFPYPANDQCVCSFAQYTWWWSSLLSCDMRCSVIRERYRLPPLAAEGRVFSSTGMWNQWTKSCGWADLNFELEIWY